MRQSSHYFHNIKKLLIRTAVDPKTGEESLSFMSVGDDGRCAETATFFFDGKVNVKGNVEGLIPLPTTHTRL